LMDKEGSFLSHHGSQYDAHALAQRIATDVRSKVHSRPYLSFVHWPNSLLFLFFRVLFSFEHPGGLSTVAVGTAQGERQQFHCHLHPLTWSCSSALNQKCVASRSASLPCIAA